jgi:hypothetical protein
MDNTKTACQLYVALADVFLNNQLHHAVHLTPISTSSVRGASMLPNTPFVTKRSPTPSATAISRHKRHARHRAQARAP